MARAPRLCARIELDRPPVEPGRHVVVQHHLKGAFRSLHLHGLTLDSSGDAGRDRDSLLADARHRLLPA